MKVQPECVPCLLRRILYETELVDKTKAYETLKSASSIVGTELHDDINSAKLATKIHREAYRILKNEDLYSEMKKRSNEVAEKILPHAQEIVNESGDSLRAAITCAIVGNVLDFGIDSPINNPEEILTKFDAFYNEGLGHDDTDSLKELLSQSKKILLFTDNCGEIVFDKLLIKELKKHDNHITLVVKGKPILTDATLEDVKNLGLYEMVDDVETTNVFAVGVDFDRISPELKIKVKEADLIISKGMANWESFSDEDFRPIAYLMRIKCIPVARTLRVSKGMNVAKLYK
jgi:uncharacterized protein with ATP-grasp and redox domains